MRGIVGVEILKYFLKSWGSFVWISMCCINLSPFHPWSQFQTLHFLPPSFKLFTWSTILWRQDSLLQLKSNRSFVLKFCQTLIGAIIMTSNIYLLVYFSICHNQRNYWLWPLSTNFHIVMINIILGDEFVYFINWLIRRSHLMSNHTTFLDHKFQYNGFRTFYPVSQNYLSDREQKLAISKLYQISLGLLQKGRHLKSSLGNSLVDWLGFAWRRSKYDIACGMGIILFAVRILYKFSWGGNFE